jgi:hypothetical protein
LLSQLLEQLLVQLQLVQLQLLLLAAGRAPFFFSFFPAPQLIF